MSDAPLLRWSIGSVTVTRVPERVTALQRDVLVPGITDELLNSTADWSAPYFHDDGRLLLSLHSFVIETDSTTIVVDTCAGADPPRALPGDAEFGARLDTVIDGGLESVDIVLCTHLHFDHVGWNTVERDGRRVPTFANARYLVTQLELDDSDIEPDLHALAVQPLLDAGQLDPISTTATLAPGVSLVPTPGHTPGHVSVLIESDGAEALITGDVAHSPIQFADPSLTATRFDADSPRACATRRALIERFVNSETLILGTHFPPPTGGFLQGGEDQPVRFAPSSPTL